MSRPAKRGRFSASREPPGPRVRQALRYWQAPAGPQAGPGRNRAPAASDPAADKLLIGSVAVFLIWKGLHPALCIALIVLELLIIANAFRRQQSGSYVSANAYGKTKMVFQVIGIGALLLFQVMPLVWLTPVAIAAFGLSLIFALFSLATYGL